MNAFILFSNEKRSELADLNPHLSNAAVSVLLGQRWREMHANEKSSYVTTARRIKEDFHAAHPDAKTRSVSRKGKKRKHMDGARFARNMAPASLHALALVGSRLNQSPFDVPAAPPRPPSSSYCHPADLRPPSSNGRELEEDEDWGDDWGEDEAEDVCEDEVQTTRSSTAASSAGGLSLLEQLCTVVENEHTAAAHMLSALGAC